jgi:hypothetical protein
LRIEAALRQCDNDFSVENCAVTIARLYSHERFGNNGLSMRTRRLIAAPVTETDLRLVKLNTEYLSLLDKAMSKVNWFAQ